MNPATLIFGDCLRELWQVEDGSVDLILCDLPYGTTACKWDSVIPFGPLWHHYRRLLRAGGVIVLTAAQPFSTALINSNPAWFRYELVWDKVGSTGFLDANRRPLRRHEVVLVFAPRGRTTYNPQFTAGEPYRTTRRPKTLEIYGPKKATSVPWETVNSGRRYPTSIVRIPGSHLAKEPKLHPTQKPLALMEWLVLTYSNGGDLVLDNSMGSGTTGEACALHGRRFVGIDSSPEHFPRAEARIRAAEARVQPRIHDVSDSREADPPGLPQTRSA